MARARKAPSVGSGWTTVAVMAETATEILYGQLGSARSVLPAAARRRRSLQRILGYGEEAQRLSRLEAELQDLPEAEARQLIADVASELIAEAQAGVPAWSQMSAEENLEREADELAGKLRDSLESRWRVGASLAGCSTTPNHDELVKLLDRGICGPIVCGAVCATGKRVLEAGAGSDIVAYQQAATQMLQLRQAARYGGAGEGRYCVGHYMAMALHGEPLWGLEQGQPLSQEAFFQRLRFDLELWSAGHWEIAQTVSRYGHVGFDRTLAMSLSGGPGPNYLDPHQRWLELQRLTRTLLMSRLARELVPYCKRRSLRQIGRHLGTGELTNQQLKQLISHWPYVDPATELPAPQDRSVLAKDLLSN